MQQAMDCPWSLMDGIRVLLGETEKISTLKVQTLHDAMKSSGDSTPPPDRSVVLVAVFQ